MNFDNNGISRLIDEIVNKLQKFNLDCDLDEARLELMSFAVEYGNQDFVRSIFSNVFFVTNFKRFFDPRFNSVKWGLFFFNDFIPLVTKLFTALPQEKLTKFVYDVYEFSFDFLDKNEFLELYFNSIFDLLKDTYKFYLLEKTEVYYKDLFNINFGFNLEAFKYKSEIENLDNRQGMDFLFFDILVEHIATLKNKWKFLFRINDDIAGMMKELFGTILNADKINYISHVLTMCFSFFPETSYIKDFVVIDRRVKEELKDLLRDFNSIKDFQVFYKIIFGKKDLDKLPENLRNSKLIQKMEKDFSNSNAFDYLFSKIGFGKNKVSEKRKEHYQWFFSNWKEHELPPVISIILDLIAYEDFNSILDQIKEKLIEYINYYFVFKEIKTAYFNFIKNTLIALEKGHYKQEPLKYFNAEFKHLRGNLKVFLGRILIIINSKILNIINDDYQEQLNSVLKERIKIVDDNLEFILEYALPFILINYMLITTQVNAKVKKNIKNKIIDSWVFNSEMKKYKWSREYDYIENILMTKYSSGENGELVEGQLTQEYVNKIEKEMPEEHPENLYAAEKLMEWTMHHEKIMLLSLLQDYPDIQYLLGYSSELVDLLDEKYNKPGLEDLFKEHAKRKDNEWLLDKLRNI